MSEFASRYTDDSTARRQIERLIEAGKNLPRKLYKELLEADDRTAQALVEVARDRKLATRGAPGGGWAPIHAVRLLGERRQTEAVDALIDVIRHADVEDMLYTRAVFALQKIGPPALEPVLEAVEAEVGPGDGWGLAEVLCELGIRDNRIFEVLLEVFHEDPQLGASYLASYGDPKALEVLHGAFASIDLDLTNPFGNHIFTELAAAIEEVGGELTPEEEAKLEQATHIRRQAARVVFGAEPPHLAAQLSPEEEQTELSPDEPCWCGSGTKFKNCHGGPERGARP